MSVGRGWKDQEHRQASRSGPLPEQIVRHAYNVVFRGRGRQVKLESLRSGT